MSNPKGYNQYKKGPGSSKGGRGTGTFVHGTKSATSSNAGGKSGLAKAFGGTLKKPRGAKKK